MPKAKNMDTSFLKQLERDLCDKPLDYIVIFNAKNGSGNYSGRRVFQNCQITVDHKAATITVKTGRRHSVRRLEEVGRINIVRDEDSVIWIREDDGRFVRDPA
jgi:hypothetical protein